jgi:hypothetical protein
LSTDWRQSADSARRPSGESDPRFKSSDTFRRVSHSKIERQPLVDRFPQLRQYVVACSACGVEGRDAGTDWENFQPPGYGVWVREAFAKELPILPLSEAGLCEVCSSALSASS